MPRPTYLNALGVESSWSVSDEKRASLQYRCRRLRGLVNIYFWAMQWSVHRANDWKVGRRKRFRWLHGLVNRLKRAMPWPANRPHDFMLEVEPYPFVLHEKQLWLLGVETVADLVDTDWDAITESIFVQERNFPKRIGNVLLADAQWDDGEGLRVDPISYRGDHDSGPLQFTGDDLAKSCRFRDDVDCIPWLIIFSELDRAYVHAEQFLKQNNVCWNGPPLYCQFQCAQELLDDIATRNLIPGVVLQELEQCRRTLVEEIETVIRANVQLAEGVSPTDNSSPAVTQLVGQVQDLGNAIANLTPKSTAEVSPTQTRDREKSKRIDAWLAERFSAREQEIKQLEDRILSNDSDAIEELREKFGPTALARSFTKEDGAEGDGGQESSNKTIITNNQQYKQKIQPLLSGQPPVDLDNSDVDCQIDDILNSAEM